jgi:ATP-dependent DNA helicase RecG
LAQLHQLRGRVGRGLHQGYCILIHALGKIPSYSEQMPLTLDSNRQSRDKIVANSRGDVFLRSTARRRLGVFAQCEDGFALAEEDLNIRGPGHVLGVKQWGEVDFRVADLARDITLLTKAKQVATELLERDPALALPEHQFIKETLFRKWSKKLALGSIG